ncbi:hypothetical protein RYH80_18740 [Halobaculum sp. MBLA0147]|uniref:hypothetical protein n=1 Tax=Halobaculum sp. MBLA0147 TaxID=3079934 RepID=UPI003524BACD
MMETGNEPPGTPPESVELDILVSEGVGFAEQLSDPTDATTTQAVSQMKDVVAASYNHKCSHCRGRSEETELYLRIIPNGDPGRLTTSDALVLCSECDPSDEDLPESLEIAPPTPQAEARRTVTDFDPTLLTDFESLPPIQVQPDNTYEGPSPVPNSRDVVRVATGGSVPDHLRDDPPFFGGDNVKAGRKHLLRRSAPPIRPEAVGAFAYPLGGIAAIRDQPATYGRPYERWDTTSVYSGNEIPRLFPDKFEDVLPYQFPKRPPHSYAEKAKQEHQAAVETVRQKRESGDSVHHPDEKPDDITLELKVADGSLWPADGLVHEEFETDPSMSPAEVLAVTIETAENADLDSVSGPRPSLDVRDKIDHPI